MGYNIKYNIFYKRIFSLWFFRFDHNSTNDDESVCLDLKINWGCRVTFSRMNLLNDEEHVSNTSAIYQTCKEILWSLFFLCEAFFPVWSHFADLVLLILFLLILIFFFFPFLKGDLYLSVKIWNWILKSQYLVA